MVPDQMTCKLSTQKVESARKNTCSCVCYSWHLNMMFCPSFSKDFIICGLSTPFPCREAAEKKNRLSKRSLCLDQQNTFLCQRCPFAMTAETPPCPGLGPVDLGDSCWHNKKDNMNSEWPSFYTNFFRQKQKWRIDFPVTPLRSELHSSPDGL